MQFLRITAARRRPASVAGQVRRGAARAARGARRARAPSLSLRLSRLPGVVSRRPGSAARARAEGRCARAQHAAVVLAWCSVLIGGGLWLPVAVGRGALLAAAPLLPHAAPPAWLHALAGQPGPRWAPAAAAAAAALGNATQVRPLAQQRPSALVGLQAWAPCSACVGALLSHGACASWAPWRACAADGPLLRRLHAQPSGTVGYPPARLHDRAAQLPCRAAPQACRAAAARLAGARTF